MKRRLDRVISILLVLLMCITIVPTSAFADALSDETLVENSGNDSSQTEKVTTEKSTQENDIEISVDKNTSDGITEKISDEYEMSGEETVKENEKEITDEELNEEMLTLGSMPEELTGEPVITVSYDTPIKCGTDTVFTVNVTGVEVFKYYLGCIEYEYSDGWYYITDPSRMPGYQESNEFSFKFCASGAYSLRFYIMYVNENGTYSTKREIVELEIEDDAYPSVSEKIDSVYAECMQAGCSSDYEIALWMHDWLVDHCKYDYSYLYCGAEGALCRGTGTCESYHRAYEMLLKKAGISCRRSEGNGHVWSNVEMDGEWYQIDVTWDDLGYSSSIYDNKHIYFGLTDALMKEVHSDHTAKSGYESNSLENNYYIKSGQIKTFSDQYKAEISEHILSGYDFFNILAKDTLPNGYDRIIINTLVAHQLEKEKWTGNVQLSAEYADGAFYFTVEKIKTITVNPSSIYLSADNPSKTVSVTLNSPTVDSSAYANVVIKVTGQANAYKAVSVDGHCNKDGNAYAVPVGAESAPSFDIVLNAYKSGRYNLQIINGNETLEVPVTVTGYSNLPQSGAEFSRIELTKTEITAPETIGITLETEDGFCGDVYGNAWFKCNENDRDIEIKLNLNEDGKLSGTFIPEYEVGIYTLEGISLAEDENYAGYGVFYQKYYLAYELPAEYRNLSFEIYNENADTTGPEIIDISLSKTKVTAPESIEIIVEATDDASGIRYGHVGFLSEKDWIDVPLNLNEEGRLVGRIDTSEKVGEFKLSNMYVADRCGNKTSYYYGELPVKFRISFNVKNENADIMPPEIISVSLSKTEVTAPEGLEVTVDATDDSSGVSGGYAYFICKETGVTCDASFDTFDREDGKLAGKLQTENLYGRFDLSELYIYDNVGNIQRYNSYQLPAAYRNLYFVVNNDNPDVTPPIVEGITLSKTRVTPPDSIEVTVDVTDDISGFRWCNIHFVNNKTGEYYGVSFTEDHLTDSIEFTNLDEIGHYEIESIYVEDVAGNVAYYVNYFGLPIEEKFRDLSFDVLSTEYYSISKNRSGKGTITVSVNGSVPVGYAKENDTVKVSLNAYNGFKFVPGSLSVKTKTDKTPVSVVDNTFIMPSCDVEIFADFEQDSEIEKYLPYKITDIQMDEDSYEYGDAAKIRVKIDGQGINGVNAYFWPPDASSFYQMPMVTLNKNGEYYEGVLRLRNMFSEGEWKLSCIEITDTNGDMFYFRNRDIAYASISNNITSPYDGAYVDLSAASFTLDGSPVENPYAITELYAIKATYKYGESIEIRFKVTDANANSADVVLEGTDGEQYYVSNIQKNKSGYFILNKRITNQMETGRWTVAVITTYDKNGNGYKFMNPWWDNDYNVSYNWEMEAIAEKVCDLSSADFTINGTKPDKDYTITNIKVGKASYLANEEVKIRLNVTGPDIDYVELHVSDCGTQTAVKVSGTNTYEATFVCTEPGEYNIEGIVIVDKYGNEYPYCNVMADEYWWFEQGPYRDFSAGDFEVLNGYGYVLRFDGNGSIKGKVEDIYYQADAVITLPENGYIRSNYMFTGWNTRRDGTGNAYMSGEEVCNIMLSNTYPTVLYAQWKATEYSIRYELNGGENSAENPVTYTVQTPTIELQNPTKEGYTFGGWYKDKSFRTKITEIAEGSIGDITLYAKWIPNTYSIRFEKNIDGVAGTMADQVMTYDRQTALKACTYKKANYAFIGWTDSIVPGEGRIYSNMESVKNLTSEAGAVLTLYAIWKPLVTSVRLFNDELEVTGKILNLDLQDTPFVQLTAGIEPEEASQTVKWTTSSAKIATVDENGLVTFLSTGSVNITAAATDGSKKQAAVTIKVVRSAETVEITAKGNATQVAAGGSLAFTAKVQPGNATDKSVTWSIKTDPGFEAYASISKTGTLSVKKEYPANGSIKVIATANGTASGREPVKAEYTVTTYRKTTSIVLDTTTLYFYKGGETSKQLYATVLPEGASKKVEWKSSNTKVATVDANGSVTVTGVSGNCKITATATDGTKKSASCTIKVNTVPVEKISISAAQTAVLEGESLQLKTVLTPAKAGVKNVKWNLVGNESEYVTLSSSGKLTVKKEYIASGLNTVTVCATALGSDATIKDEMEISVFSPITSIQLFEDGKIEPLNLKTKGTLWVGQKDKMTLKAKVLPSTACQEVTWTSSNTKIATVDQNGNVTALSAGTVTIKATSCDGKKKSVSYTINVKQPVEGIRIEVAQNCVVEGAALQLKAILSPTNPTDKTVKWELNTELNTELKTSSDVSLSSSGKLTVKKGYLAAGKPKTIEIQVTANGSPDSENNPVKDTIQIQVYSPIQSIQLYADEMQIAPNTKGQLGVGEELKLRVETNPENACDTFTWTSSNIKIATVDENGNVTALKVGTVTIKATSCDGQKKSISYTIVVK